MAGVRRLLAVLMAMLPTLIVLLVTAPGVRLASRDTRITASSVLRAASATQVHAVPLDACSDEDRLSAVEAGGTDTSNDDDADDSDDSPSNEPSSEEEDDSGGDEMIVRSFEPILGASLVAVLWHETPKLSGVIHTPEPRPARSV